jgi:hypothetical protein
VFSAKKLCWAQIRPAPWALYTKQFKPLTVHANKPPAGALLRRQLHHKQQSHSYAESQAHPVTKIDVALRDHCYKADAAECFPAASVPERCLAQFAGASISASLGLADSRTGKLHEQSPTVLCVHDIYEA